VPAFSPPDAAAIPDLLARCTFPAPRTRVTCAVSGGADSSALLVLAVAAGCSVDAVHVDHGLRDDSAAEADVVRDLAARLGAEFRSVAVEIAPGPNMEARAREARRSVLPPDAMTGHTADDQSETLLINLLRGSAATGLAAMRPGRRHPILGLRRRETVGLCAALGIGVVEDPMNADRRFLRTRVRHDLLPALTVAADRDLVPVLCRQADLLRDDDDLLETLADAVDPTDAPALTAAPAPLARRAVRRWLASVDRTGYRPDAAAVRRVLDVAAGRAVACELPGGVRVSRHRQRLVASGDGTTTAR
jgi:tRNA(Ile)-lysidine synthase